MLKDLFLSETFLWKKMVATRIQVYIILMTMFTGKYSLFVNLYVHLDCIEHVAPTQVACL